MNLVVYADFSSPDCYLASRRVDILATGGVVVDWRAVERLPLLPVSGRRLSGPVFTDVARMDLAAHLPVMCDFWQTVLFRSGTYRGNAFSPHQRLHDRTRLTPAHFARWLTLWQAAVNDRFTGPKAEFAKLQAERIAGSMSRRITGNVPRRKPSRSPVLYRWPADDKFALP